MTGRLEGKSALITGSARGIGRAFAEAYIREGATVAIADIDFERASKTAREIGENAYAVELDVTKQHSIDTAVRTVEGQTGGLDILINNAALFDLAPIVEIKRESYERLFSINVSGTLFMMQAAAKTMIARGKGGKIINMASQAGRRGEGLVAIYCATKAAVISSPNRPGSISSSTASTSMRSRPAWSMASTGTAWMRCLRNMKTARPVKRSGWSGRPCPSAAWAVPRT